MSRRVHVRVPASSTNLGAGFDCIGVAVDRWLGVSVTIDPADASRGVPVEKWIESARASAPAACTAVVERAGSLEGLAVAPADDRIVVGFRAACEDAGREPPPGLRIHADSTIPVARGLGSSAAAAVAGVVAANALLDLRLSDHDIVRVAARVEGHPDNAAAAVLGGATLAASAGGRLDAVPLWMHDSLALVLAVPDFTLETAEARRRLPASVSHQVASRAAALSGALVYGLATADATLLAAALEEDVLHVPYRRALITAFDDVVGAARGAGALGTTLSGSGSTLVAIAHRADAPAVAEAMRGAWAAAGVAAEAFVNPPRVGGYEVVVSQPREDAGMEAGPPSRTGWMSRRSARKELPRPSTHS
ncbi:MAG TPA: homoserine kinase [Gemmatimonadaceae bacterium]|nr:homoserine kinase [Gemmatimonadaceae bacterium]